jgi:hypothetical protein
MSQIGFDGGAALASAGFLLPLSLWSHASNSSSSGVGPTAAEEGDDRVSDADQHDDISHNGSSDGGNVDSAEMAGLDRCTH